MKIEDMMLLMEAVSKHGIEEFSYKTEHEEIKIGKSNPRVVEVAGGYVPAAKEVLPVASIGAAVEPAESIESFVDGNMVKSPLVGTFYAAPSPDSPAFVKVGDTVKKGQVLGIIEAMKLMNEIESEFDGVVEAILVSDGSLVEYNQPLFCIK